MSLDMILSQVRIFLITAFPCAIVCTILIYVFFKYIIKKEIRVWKLLPSCFFFLNIVFIIYLTLLTRSEAFGDVDLHLFRSYREAWNTFSVRNWQLIIFNILVFLPFGTLLPLLVKKFRTAFRTVGTGFLFSLSIETLQRLTHRGLFEADDLFHNTLGVLLGYCIFYFLHTLLKKKPFHWFQMVACILPFPLLIGGFGMIFYHYQHKEYGNLPINYTYRVDLSKAQLQKRKSLTLQKTSQTVPLLMAESYEKEDAMIFASDLLDRMGISGTNRYSYYDDSIVCYRGRHNIVVYPQTRSYEYHDMKDTTNVTWGDMDVIQLKKRLLAYGIEVPSNAIYSHPTKGVYQWTIPRTIHSKNKLAGTLVCITTSDGEIYSITDQMVQHSVYQNVSIRSEQDAYQRLKDGYFQILLQDEEIHSIFVNDVSLTYSCDTKGFYQPVYLFHCKVNGENRDLVIPAIKD